jgi:hypothetical protein
MNPSYDQDLLDAAQAGKVSYELLRRVAERTSRSPPDVLDDVSYVIASEYAADRMSFEQADIAMNALWALSLSREFGAEHDHTIPGLTTMIYLAFDAGEYRRRTDPPDTDPQAKYTKPDIIEILAENDRPSLTR